MNPNDIPALLDRLVAGDEMAAQEFDRHFRPRIMRMAIGHGLRRENAEDIAQQALAAALIQLREGRFRSESAVGTWIAGIARHKIDDYWRTHDRHSVRLVPIDAQGNSTQPGEEISLADEPRIEISLQVQETLRAMPPELKVILVLNEVERWTIDEIAAWLQKPAGTVGRKLSEAREWFRQAWKKGLPEPREGGRRRALNSAKILKPNSDKDE